MEYKGKTEIKLKPFFSARPQAKGKFIFVGEEKFWVKGVTYGAFKPNDEGKEFHNDALIERDFKQMAANGINTVRIPHTMPPRSLLDIAERCGLHVMVGLSAEQYAGYLIDKKGAPDVPALIRAKVREVAGHPAILCYAIGNEIQASLVRWIGAKKVESYLKSIYWAIKSEDPEGLVTYVNYPTTEYLQLPFLDILSLNVYLESQIGLAAYLKRLHNIAGDRPLLMSELGLDAIRNGELAQAESLEWQIKTVFSSGCAGAVVFSWTDEWYRAEAEVEDWAFGLTTKDREPKPALASVQSAFSEVPFASDKEWPKISIVVCSFNGANTIRDTMEGIRKLDYPNYEVIVVNDGSTDETPNIVAEYPVILISTENQGLSSARNTGWQEATGEIIAYIDDDAYPDPHWLTFIADVFMNSSHVGVGGPNIAPANDGLIAEAVANSPGGPVHVLLTDELAEHIPGCNMAFRKEALAEVGGFDPRYRAAGDDVDICWKLQQKGWTLGFSAAAMDWHHRRNSFRAYWRQQIGYGKAEALLEEKWPEKYNALGHTTWGGKLYGSGLTLPIVTRQRIYQGIMGGAPFQSLYEPAPGFLISLPLMPEWYLLVALLGILSLTGLFWSPLLAVLPFFGIAVALPILQAIRSANKSKFMHHPGGWSLRRLKLWLLTALLHLIQPLARLVGRLRHGLTLWRKRGKHTWAFPARKAFAIWTEKWEPPETRPYFIEKSLLAKGIRVWHGTTYDRWDLAVGGLLGNVRMLMAIEDHGAGTQYVRIGIWPIFSRSAVVLTSIFAILSVSAALNNAWVASLVFGFVIAGIMLRAGMECAYGMGALIESKSQLEQQLTN